MVADPSISPPAEEPRRSGGYHYHDILTGTDPACDESDEQAQLSDGESHDTDSMSNCTVICGDRKWEMNKAVLCSNNEWFRAAFEGPFREASTREVIIENTDPKMVQIVLDMIFRRRTYWYLSKPAEIVEIWKAGDFFCIPDLVNAAQNALSRRLEASAAFLRSSPDPYKILAAENTRCARILTEYGDCRHLVSEPRACPVHNVRAQTGFYLCVPEHAAFRQGRCGACRLGRDAATMRMQRPPDNPDKETRTMIDDEIRTLCEALLAATVGSPQGSRMQKALINHMCNTRIAAWGGYTVCRLLEV